MKTIVIYNSQTGFTKRYAEWIAEAAGADCLAFSTAKKKDQWTDKKLIVFCVGGSPLDNPDIEPALKQNFSETERKKVNVFYCPGGFDYEKMSVSSKLMMKMFLNMLKGKKEKTEAEQVMIKMISSSYDISDKKYIKPILQCLER